MVNPYSFVNNDTSNSIDILGLSDTPILDIAITICETIIAITPLGWSGCDAKTPPGMGPGSEYKKTAEEGTKLEADTKKGKGMGSIGEETTGKIEGVINSFDNAEKRNNRKSRKQRDADIQKAADDLLKDLDNEPESCNK